MNFGKISTTYLNVANLTLSERLLLTDVIAGSGLSIFSGSYNGLREEQVDSYFSYLYFRVEGGRNGHQFTRFKEPSYNHSLYKEVSYKEYLSYFEQGSFEHNKQKFQII